MYSEKDFDVNRARLRRQWQITGLLELPFLCMLIAGFAIRMEPLAIAGAVLAGAALVFMWDLRIAPLWRYKRYLKEIHSGLSRRTAGALVRIDPDPVYKEGVWLRELYINIYEDLSEEGERRFLLDCAKEVDSALLDCDVVVTSHGNYVLNVEPLGGAKKEETP